MDPQAAFAELQRRLPAAWAADRPGSGVAHTVVALPSFSLDRRVYDHYGDRVPPLENRFLHCLLLLRRPEVRIVYLSSRPVPPAVLDGYLALLPPTAAERLVLISPDDASARPLARKLLDRADLVTQVRAAAHPTAVVEAWNVTDAERDLALALDIPVFGTAPELRPLATKSNGRRLMRDAGVPVPRGIEDVHSPDDVAAAVSELLADGPLPAGVVVKLDDSVAGDGNVVLPAAALGGDVRGAVDSALPEWYVEALRGGGVVEERIAGTDFRSPSCQADLTPAGEVVVLATHEQRLGGPDAQVYEGCSCPADPGYAPQLAAHTVATGRALAAAGAVGRFAVDFVACRSGGTWQLHALEINLRKGGTTHTLGITRLLTAATYDAATGVLVTPAGGTVHYAATDNLVDPRWRARTPDEVRALVAGAALAYDDATGSGVVPHLLDCLPVDGRMGYTAIGPDAAAVAALETRLLDALA